MKPIYLLPLIILVVVFGSVAYNRYDFIESHWNHPLEEQGPPPQNFTSIESKLTPENCGSCHTEQFSLWKNSLHRESANIGLGWQLHGLGELKSDTCLNCHSPLWETRTLIKIKEGWKNNYSESMNSYFPSDGTEHGISCSSCHVRKHTRYGPPPLMKGNSNFNSPHQGFIVKKEFESSLFCKNCHESNSDSSRVGNKKMMETFSEWESSDFQKKGVQCQSCHMPNRNHLWKGIHDKEMVLSGIEKKITFKSYGDEIEIIAEVRSTNIGHKFPTYAVPKIYLNLFLQDKWNGKKPIGDFVIGRLMDIHLTKEFYDTRIEPGKKVIVSAKIAKDEIKKYTSVVFEADVQPDELYERMFQYNLENKETLGHTTETQNMIRESLLQKQKSKYNLFILNVRVPDQFLQ